MDNFYCDVEAAERACLLYVRYIHGRDLAKPAPKDSRAAECDYNPGVKSKRYRRKSEVTYHSHPEISNYEYNYLQTLLCREAFVVEKLTEAGIDAINAEDTTPKFKMSGYRERQLGRAYKLIAREFKNGRYPWDKWNQKTIQQKSATQ